MFKFSVWFLAITIFLTQSGDLLQPLLIRTGVLKRPFTIQDLCDEKFLPASLCSITGYASNEMSVAKIKKSRIRLPGIMLEKLKKKDDDDLDTLKGRLAAALKRVKKMVLPKNFKMPCLTGDCGMGEKIKREREEYESLFLDKKSKKSSKIPEEKDPDVAEKRDEPEQAVPAQ